jgi:hypothetical protein
MKQETNTSLRVMLWGHEIGRLAWHQGRKTTYFYIYSPDFLKGDLDVAPLMASIHQSTEHTSHLRRAGTNIPEAAFIHCRFTAGCLG